MNSLTANLAEELSVDPRVLVFALLASVITGLVFGTFPALYASRKEVAEALQEGSATSTASRRGRRTRSGLVVAEIALALILLSSAGLFFKSLLAIGQADPGFLTEHLVDKATLSGVMAILGSTALLASLIPAIKAARTDPQETLKAD